MQNTDSIQQKLTNNIQNNEAVENNIIANNIRQENQSVINKISRIIFSVCHKIGLVKITSQKEIITASENIVQVNKISKDQAKIILLQIAEKELAEMDISQSAMN
ncbi:MAG: hypothetical protein WCJ33_01110 [Pseudomonadota bacterium]